MNRQQGGGGPAQPVGRPGLIPAESLPVWKALVQVFILLGIPIALLVIARFILRRYFPELGY
jgi:ACR3 family arsenite efflux pump ArsB